MLPSIEAAKKLAGLLNTTVGYLLDENEDTQLFKNPQVLQMIRYTVKLTKGEVEELTSIINKGSHTSQTFRVACILLNCDEGKYSEKVTNEQISKVLKAGMRTIDRIKKRFVEEGFEAVLERRPTTRMYESKIDGDTEAKLVKLCCSGPPKAHAKWSLRLLADKMVELKYVENISHVTVRSVLKKTNLNPGK